MRIAMLALVLIGGAAFSAEPGPSLQPFDFLVGHCWRGSFPDGKSEDTHCFESVYGGRFVRDRHVVRGEQPDYSGESIYWLDPRTRRISYLYFNSAGGVSTGIAVANGTKLQFGDEKYIGPDGKEQHLRTVWDRRGDDGYIAVTEQEANGTWVEAWRVEFRRAAAVPEGN
jgi:hypothetical protein